MIITISNLAKQHLAELSTAGNFGLSISQGCCGKSFVLDSNPAQNDTRRFIEVDGVRFAVDDEVERLAPEVAIDYPGPVDGFMISNLGATGSCACGRSFFVEE